MAAIAAVLSALLRSGWRSLRGARSFTANNLIAVIALLMAEEPRDRPSSTAIIYLMVGLLWTLPLSQELTRRIPPNRFRLWPLRPWQRAAIVALNLLLNPLIVIAILFGSLSRERAVGVALGALGALAPFAVLLGQSLAGRRLAWSPLQRIGRPPGRLGGLIQEHLRELLQLLDAYLAALLAVGGIFYCYFSAKPDPMASVVMGILVVVLMSTCAQGHTSFDARAWETRMRLLPLSGIDMLLAKDLAWLIVTLPLVSAFHPVPALASGLAALTVGHSTAIDTAMEQRRWNFATGRLAPQGLYQLFALVVAGSTTVNWGWPVLVLVCAVYAGSLWWSARTWDRRYGRQIFVLNS